MSSIQVAMQIPVLEEAGVQLKTEELKPVLETSVNLVTMSHLHGILASVPD